MKAPSRCGSGSRLKNASPIEVDQIVLRVRERAELVSTSADKLETGYSGLAYLYSPSNKR